jgi:GMP synthase-like glutamine amidotransferase
MNEKICIVKHVEDEGPGLLGDFFQCLGWEISLVEPYRGDAFPETLDSIAGVVVLGGPMNVYEEDDYPFLKEETTFIRHVLNEEIPYLGICLGGQLLAKACGAPVTKLPRREMGWYHVRLTPEGLRDGLFRGVPKDTVVFQWHEDTFAIPAGGALLGTSRLCANQAFRVGNSAYGLQFHMEVTPEMIRCWSVKEGPAVRLKKIEDETEKWHERLWEQGETIFANFQRIIESARRVRRTIALFADARRRRPVHLWWNPEKRALLGQ